MLVAGCSTRHVEHGIPNLAQVAPNVWRGGQPEDAKAWAYLHDVLGITHDVKLNTEAEGSDAGAEAAGMFVHRFPILFWRQLLGPDQNQMDSIVRAATEYPFGVFIHCSHGEDRTGLVVATYLHEVEGWPKNKAEVDMLAHNFHRSLFGLWWFWRQEK